MNKKEMSEEDIKLKFITPAIEKAGWDKMSQITMEQYYSVGQIRVNNNDEIVRGDAKFIDYILSFKKNIPIAVVEAKDNKHSIGAGIQQALDYANDIDVPFVFSSNGDGFIFHDKTKSEPPIEIEIGLHEFPSPQELWKRYCNWKGLDPEEEKITLQDYFVSSGDKEARYYQVVAINRTVEAIAKDRKRMMLVMATGTGKTYTAFQIIWRLWKARKMKRILFLADRNILVDQTMVKDFKHFGNRMTKIQDRKVDKSYEIYLSLYQALTGNENTEDLFKNFSKDFFDLVVIDECHRGSANENSKWREVLDYFSSATHLGLTATPKDEEDVSNFNYFGEPIYTYTLKQGIEDGFLAPYKVIKVTFDKDKYGWEPDDYQTDNYGHEIEKRNYTGKDFDRRMVIEERTKAVARKITDYLKRTNRYDKTIIFCVDQDHADRLRRELVNLNADMMKENDKYIVRITSDDEIGKKELENFINPSIKYPVVVTTSKLLTTGVDSETCKLIVLDANIGSMTEFKQIIGRGTRINEEYDKRYFTIMDFRNVTNKFEDPEFDGTPLDQEEEKIDENPLKSPPKIEPGIFINPPIRKPLIKYYVKGIEICIEDEEVSYYEDDGTRVNSTMEKYIGKYLKDEYGEYEVFENEWNSNENKTLLIEEISKRNPVFEQLWLKYGKEYDLFDIITHFGFGKELLTRRERVEKESVRMFLSKHNKYQVEILTTLLEKYVEFGITMIEDIKILKLNPFDKIGTSLQIVNEFGGKKGYKTVLDGLKNCLYLR